MEFELKKMKAIKSIMAVFALAVLLCTLLSINVIHLEANVTKHERVSVFNIQRTIELMNEQVWRRDIVKKKLRAIA